MVRWRFCAGIALACSTGVTLAVAPPSAAAGPANPGVQLYSFETLYNDTGVPDPTGTRPDNFTFNGGGTTVSQDTLGATSGAHSLKFTQATSATFTAAITTLLSPTLNSQDAIGMDVTIPDTGNFSGNFANLGVSEFGDNTSQGLTGQQVQTVPANEARVALAPGTYRIGVPLIALFNPITFELNPKFSSVFGSDPNTQLTPASWEIYVNKSPDSTLEMYIDNVRLFELIPGDANVDATVDTLDFNALAANFGQSGRTWRTADFNADGTVDTLDFNSLAANFGRSASSEAARGAGLVPEPTTALLGCFTAIGLSLRRPRLRQRRNQGSASCAGLPLQWQSPLALQDR